MPCADDGGGAARNGVACGVVNAALAPRCALPLGHHDVDDAPVPAAAAAATPCALAATPAAAADDECDVDGRRIDERGASATARR